ncbi:ABC transporter permease subunit [Desulfosarcina variabilis]|uniref:ABC transporter permease subunit n=1 Tax=Desulfosarcina variabilis TaxID=2300 RepID=UPI003AFA311E
MLPDSRRSQEPGGRDFRQFCRAQSQARIQQPFYRRRGTINSVALALYALGFALVYGICRLPNFAHGALYVLSGFIA